MEEPEVAQSIMPVNRGGAPLGNQNARKHGFYSRRLNDEERAALDTAAEMRGLDAEIAVLRVKFQSLVDAERGNIDLAIQTAGLIARLLKIRDNLSSTKDERYELAMSKIYLKRGAAARNLAPRSGTGPCNGGGESSSA